MPSSFSFFCFMQGRPQYGYATTRAEYGRNCTKTTGGRRILQMKVTKNLKRRLEKAKKEVLSGFM